MLGHDRGWHEAQLMPSRHRGAAGRKLPGGRGGGGPPSTHWGMLVKKAPICAAQRSTASAAACGQLEQPKRSVPCTPTQGLKAWALRASEPSASPHDTRRQGGRPALRLQARGPHLGDHTEQEQPEAAGDARRARAAAGEHDDACRASNSVFSCRSQQSCTWATRQPAEGWAAGAGRHPRAGGALATGAPLFWAKVVVGRVKARAAEAQIQGLVFRVRGST